MPHTIHLVLNNGRNINGIYRDVLKILEGFCVSRITLICMRAEEVAYSTFDTAPLLVNVEYRVVGEPSRECSPTGEECDEIVVVANGGTTRQQFLGYEIYSREREEWAVSSALREGSRHKPVRILDVQPDSWSVLAHV